MSHMWIALDEGWPDGCSDLDILFENGRIDGCCSCDLHWDVQLKRELPMFYRLSSLEIENRNYK
jgi:hypothetical protein